MRLRAFGLGIEIKRMPASPVDARGGWHSWIREPFGGAWQRDIEWTADSVLANHAVYACVTLIANDVGKLRPRLVEYDAHGIRSATTSAAFSPVLRQPNTYQNRIQFIEWWMTSKLIRGNTYALKQFDDRNVVRRLYLLDPQRVTVLVAPDGQVFYDLNQDNLSGLRTSVQVPASWIIHDRMNCLYHPLVGVSPLYAAGPAAEVGLRILTNAGAFFGNGSNPSGLLTTAVSITPAKAKEISDRWNTGFTGDNTGKVAVLGDGMKFEPLRMTAVDSQLMEQAKHTAETVCSAFHVPPFKIGVGAMPTNQNADVLNSIYYSDCLQSHIEQFELCMSEGLGIGEGNPKEGTTYAVELDTDALLRMDQSAQIEALAASVGAAIHAPNEARRKLDLKPVPGGDSPYLQQQNYSLAALAKRDAAGPPPTSPGDRRQPAAPAAPAADEADEDDADTAPNARALLDVFRKAFAA